MEQGDDCYLSPQVLIEMWVVATRPTDVNGLGWSTDHARKIIDELLERFPLADEIPQIFLDLTLNPNDFSGIVDVIVVTPQGIIDSTNKDKLSS